MFMLIIKQTQHNTTQHNKVSLSRVYKVYYISKSFFSQLEMVCQTCRGVFTMTHNARTCPMNNTIVPLSAIECYFPAIAEEPKAPKSPQTPAFESLRQCYRMFEEPKAPKAPKASKAPKAIVASPAEKRVAAELGAMLTPVEGKVLVASPAEKRLAAELGAMLAPVEGKAKKSLKTCSACGEKGHNSRTCINITKTTTDVY